MFLLRWPWILIRNAILKNFVLKFQELIRWCWRYEITNFVWQINFMTWSDLTKNFKFVLSIFFQSEQVLAGYEINKKSKILQLVVILGELNKIIFSKDFTKELVQNQHPLPFKSLTLRVIISPTWPTKYGQVNPKIRIGSGFQLNKITTIYPPKIKWFSNASHQIMI